MNPFAIHENQDCLRAQLNENMLKFSEKLDTLKGKGVDYYFRTGPFYKPQIMITKNNEPWCDVISHNASYGGNQGLLEGGQGPFATELDDVTGFLTCDEAFALVEKKLNIEQEKISEAPLLNDDDAR